MNIDGGKVDGVIHFTASATANPAEARLTINNAAIVNENAIYTLTTAIQTQNTSTTISNSQITNDFGTGVSVSSTSLPAQYQASLSIDNSKIFVKDEQGIFNGRSRVEITNTEINVSGSGAKASGITVNAGLDENGQAPTSTYVNKSTINSNGSGAYLVGGVTQISNSIINASGDFGIVTKGGNILLNQGTTINGKNDAFGIYLTKGYAGDYVDNNLTIDNASVNAKNNIALIIGKDATANIELQNDARLTSGKGTILHAMDNATVVFGVDNSTISGNIAAAQTASLDLNLKNNASLSGNIINANNLTIDGQSRWNINNDSNIKNLNSDGQIVFSSSATKNQRALPFSTLNVANLSGDGSFAMRVEGANGDFLNVTDTTQGKHTIYLPGSGKEGSDGYHLIQAKGSAADSFSLSNGVVELGTYQYSLTQSNDDWFLALSGTTPPLTPTPTPTPDNTRHTSSSTDAVLSMAAANQFIFDGEMQGLRKGGSSLYSAGLDSKKKDNGSIWGRYLTNNTRVNTANGAAFKLQQDGLQIGGDKAFDLSSGALLAGVFTSYTDNTVKHARGGRSNIDSYGAGVYLTYFDNAGYYIDSVIKANRFSNSMKARMIDGNYSTADYHQNAIGGSLEAGYRFDITDSWFTEPYLRGSYFIAESKNIELNNGMKANTGNNRSARGELGTIIGTKLSLQNGSEIKPYVRLAVEREFIKHNTVNINQAYDFNNDLSGNTGKYGAGVDIKVTPATSVYAEANYRQGSHVESPVMANMGFRISF